MKFFVATYLILIGIISVALTIYDKLAARKGRRRIPEKTLLILAALGGSLAMLVVMRIIRHKTLHKKFMIGIPVIIILQLAIIAFLLSRQ